MSKDRLLSFAISLSKKYGKQLLDTIAKIGLDTLKTASKKVVHKAAEATEEFIGNKVPEKIIKPKSLSYQNSRNAEEIIISSENREEILNGLRKVFLRWNSIKNLNY